MHRDEPAGPQERPADAFTTWAGPYVLGALSPGDADAFARHLPACASCRAAVQDLAALPGLLSRVPLDGVDGLLDPSGGADPSGGVDLAGDATPPGIASPGPVPDTLLPALLRSVRAQRRRRRWAGGVAAGLVAASALAAVVVTTDRAPREQVRALPSPSAPASTGLPSASLPSASLPSTALPSASPQRGPVSVLRPLLPIPLTITARLTGADWGTQVDVTCAYAPETASPPYDYALVVTDRAGAVEQLGTWTAVPGHDAQLTGVTALPRAQIASVEVRTLDGTPIARLDPPAS